MDLITIEDDVSLATESVGLVYDGPMVTDVTFGGTLDESIGFDYRNGDLALQSITYAGNEFNLGYDADGLLTMAESWLIYRDVGGVPNETGLAEKISDGTLTITPEYLAPGESLMDGAVYGVDYSINSTSVMSWDVTRNDLGQIDAKTEVVGTTTSEYEYIYDAGGRLEEVWLDSTKVEDYSYDSQGRRTGDTDGRVYNYDSEDHLTSVVDGVKTTVYMHDVDGFLTMKEVDLDGDTFVDETTTYEYGARGELIRVVLPDTTEIEYVNGPSGQRIAKVVNDVVVEKYLWGGLTNLLAIYDGNDTLLQRFEYAGGRLPVAMFDGMDTHYLHYDQVGSLRAITDDAGNVVREIVYDSFGNILGSTGTGPEVPIAFAGGLYDADTGLMRFGFRDYDAEAGRWTAKDPIGFGGGDADLYQYCAADPLNCIDPSGLRVYARQCGNDVAIVLPIIFEDFDVTTLGLLNLFEGIREITDRWSGQFGKYNVRTQIVTDTDLPLWFNKWTYHNKEGRAKVYWNTEGHLYANDSAWTMAHEAGHFMGLPDRYHPRYLLFGESVTDKGWEGNIMGADSGFAFGKPFESDIEAILEYADEFPAGWSDCP